MQCRNETEQLILKVAVTLFGERGKDAVSIADIADAAGVNRSLIFYYFVSKDGLYLAAFRSQFEEFAATVSSHVVPLEPGIGMIEQFIREHIAFLRTHPALIRFIVRELLLNQTGKSELLPELAKVIRPFRDTLIGAFHAAREKGQIRDVDPVQSLVNILSLNVFFFLGKPVVNLMFDKIDFEQFEREREDHVIDLLMHGLVKQGESQ
jgi:TetR/AcrR family transcriptional regulator